MSLYMVGFVFAAHSNLPRSNCVVSIRELRGTHDSSLRTKVPELDALFHSTELLQVLSSHLPQYELQFGTSDRTLKLQRNARHGGCFPCHYDNPGAKQAKNSRVCCT
ncbi:hypothetical protein PR002_g14493 [Phytophthora rubi]|uniref:Uncharacterized protein n=1 Tax=Phytophthora rubi TaxID=129364 RepID=A0A6A3L1H1_9STRA|nr:hypothetical protein PR002_g14493 [Phytophthora rubi]